MNKKVEEKRETSVTQQDMGAKTPTNNFVS
jgi:hypothetical protein